MKPWRSREYLDLSYVEGKTCVRCGRGGCEPCHYSGMYSDRLGKGGAQKSMDAAVADLCRECHVYFDQYVSGNDDERAAEFMLMILLTLHRNLQRGHTMLVSIRIGAIERREGLPEKEGAVLAAPHSLPPSRRRKRRATTAAANQVKRSERWMP